MSHTITAKVIATEYASTSMYGNPAYWLTLQMRDGDTVRLRTSDNVSFAYACTNADYRDSWHTYTLTRAGRIRYAHPVADKAA